MHVAGSYAVEWFTLAVITAGIAQGKQRSGRTWFVLALIGGPLATLVLVVLHRSRESTRGMPRRLPKVP